MPTALDPVALRVLLRYVAENFPRGREAAERLVRTAADIAGTFGKAFYAEFISQGVLGLPSDPRIRGLRDTHLLSAEVRRAAEQFGARAYRLLLARLGDAGMVDDAIQGLLVRVTNRGLKLLPDTLIKQAEGYVLQALINEGRDIRRKQVRHRHRHRQFDEPGVPDLDEPAAFRRLEGLVPRSQLAAILKSLERVHVRAPEYFELLLNGYNPAEIARAWGVSQPYVAKWTQRYGPQVQEAVRRHVEAGARSGGRSSVFELDTDSEESPSVRYSAQAHCQPCGSEQVFRANHTPEYNR